MLPEVVAAVSASDGRTRQPLVVARGRAGTPAAGSRSRREQLAAALGARPSEVIFTGGGTEADNLAVKGIYWARRAADPRRRRVIVSAVEHHAVLDAVDWLGRARGRRGRAGCRSTRTGGVDPEALRAALADDPDAVAAGQRDVGQQRGRHASSRSPSSPRSRTSTASRSTPTRCRRSARCRSTSPRRGVDALTMTGHKLGGPFGAGALLLRPRRRAALPLLHGGGQERDVRSGTLDVAGRGRARHRGRRSPSSAAPSTAAAARRAARRARRRRPRGRAGRRASTATRRDRLPGIAHLCFPGCEGDALLMLLDARGVECSTGSACSAGVAQPSHVLLAMGCRRADGARLAAVLARPHLDRRPTSRPPSRRSARPSSGPAAPGCSACRAAR